MLKHIKLWATQYCGRGTTRVVAGEGGIWTLHQMNLGHLDPVMPKAYSLPSRHLELGVRVEEIRK